MMKTAFVSLLALGCVSAFAPSQGASKPTRLAASAEMESMVGVSVETGKKFVSSFLAFCADDGGVGVG